MHPTCIRVVPLISAHLVLVVAVSMVLLLELGCSRSRRCAGSNGSAAIAAACYDLLDACNMGAPLSPRLT